MQSYITDIFLAKRYGVSRQLVWKWVRTNPNFPKPIKLSPGCTRWIMADIEEWEQSKIAHAS